MPEKTLAQRIANVQSKITAVERDGVNPAFKHRYASKDAIMKAIRPLLAAEGIAALVSCDRQWIEADGKARVEMRLILTDGTTTLEILGQGEGADKFDKAVYKAQTGATRYLLSQAFLIDTGDDAEEHSEAPAPQPAQKRATTYQVGVLRREVGRLRKLDLDHPTVAYVDKNRDDIANWPEERVTRAIDRVREDITKLGAELPPAPDEEAFVQAALEDTALIPRPDAEDAS
jgi:hypothetical protein